MALREPVGDALELLADERAHAGTGTRRDRVSPRRRRGERRARAPLVLVEHESLRSE